MDLFCGSFKILVQHVMPVKVEGIYPNSFRCIYKSEFLFPAWQSYLAGFLFSLWAR